ncbi:hypothetical protein GmHk_11G032528 [Glycine max]|nr:hypothetical protein GmHk_11G032528 [Glycine max]
MDEDQWMYDSVMTEEVDMNDQNEDEVGVNEEHVFATCDDVLYWPRSFAYEIGFVAVIISSYKTNRYRLSLLDIVDVTPTGMTFSTAFAYLEGEHLNNVNILPRVIVTDRDLALMNAVKIVFPEATNLLCRFHIDKNVKAKCKTLIAAEFEHVHYVGKNPSRCGCIMRTIHGLPCACELSRYVVGTISLETIHVLVGAKFFRPRVI